MNLGRSPMLRHAYGFTEDSSVNWASPKVLYSPLPSAVAIICTAFIPRYLSVLLLRHLADHLMSGGLRRSCKALLKKCQLIQVAKELTYNDAYHWSPEGCFGGRGLNQ
jgi:hypothetical protein